jgi:Zn-dependent membrane protease YugP
MPFFYYFDPVYFMYMIPGLIVALWAQFKVKSSYNKYSRILSVRGLTGADVARRIMMANNINNVEIKRIDGQMTDNFNPQNNTINLSEGVYDSTSIAAIGIAAHEAGHAVQHAVGYSPIKLRMLLVPICNFGSTLSVPLIIIGYFLSYNYNPLIGYYCTWAGIILFSLAIVFQLVTLPVEFNASARAMAIIRSDNLLYEDESEGAKKMLTAAALTYVAALLQSLLLLLYYIARFGNRRQ